AAWSPDGTWIVTASDDGSARIWSARYGKLVVAVMRHDRGTVTVAEVSADGRFVLTAGSDHVARLWALPNLPLAPMVDGSPTLTADTLTSKIAELPAARVTTTFTGHTDTIVAATFGGDDDRLVATASADRVARVWDRATGQVVASYEHGDLVTSVAFAATDDLVTASHDGSVRIWDPRLLEVRHRLDSAIHAIALAADGTVAVGTDDSHVTLFHGEATRVLREHLGRVHAVAFTPDGTSLVTAGDDPHPIVWNVASGQPRGRLGAHATAVRAVAISPDGRTVATGATDGVQLATLAGAPIRTLDQRGATMHAVAFDPSGAFVLGGADDGALVVWDLEGGVHDRRGGMVGAVTALAFSPVDHALVVAGRKHVRIYPYAAGRMGARPTVTLEGPTGEVRAVVVSRDGALVITGSDDGIARVWDAAKGKLLGTRDPAAARSARSRSTVTCCGSAPRTARSARGTSTASAARSMPSRASWSTSTFQNTSIATTWSAGSPTATPAGGPMSVEQTTASRLAKLGDDGSIPGTAYLLVFDNDSSSIFHLPQAGVVVIGRGTEAELRIVHASVSRRHAAIRIDEGIIRIADLGSHNGSRVNGEPVAGTRTLASGDVVTVGDVVLVVHFSAPITPTRAAYGEAGWRRRLAEEIDRATTFQRTLAVVAVLDAGASVIATLGAGLRLIDVVGTSDDGHTLLLLPEVGRDQARELVERALAATPTPVRAGLAMCPADACDVDTLLLAARTAARRASGETLSAAAETATLVELGTRQVLLADPAMGRVFALLERLATSDLPVLIAGEPGVGKENAAFAVHHWSKRTGAFIAVNCAAIGPESLIDSELFGHDKGAFTGATAAKAGLFESAAGGTVFLDEVGELPLAIQAKLLRTLEVRTVTRLGESRERPIDFRVVAATNRALEAEVTAGRFRQDLYFRLSGATVILPPLRHRRCEIPLLARSFLADASASAGRPPMTITSAAMQILLTHAWPGNVRELKHAMEYVAAAAPDETVEPADLPERLGGAGMVAPTSGSSVVVGDDVPATTKPLRPIAEELRELERQRMAEALVAAGGVKTRAAQLIEMPIRTFTLKLKQYKL
ncbi:MAG: sigma 54-interacting transcriptional regulator, partial [Proteobacteria bacterium]|nr:sigma 54-interacting transcriptional regulator [Pseudomonadota bacterium]